MADEGVEHCGQGDVARCEVTRTSTSSGVSLTEVISRPSGKGNKGDEGINLLEKRFLCCLEQIFGRSLRILRLLHQKVGRANYTRSLIGACPHCLQIEVRRGKIGTCSHVLTQWHNTPTHLREGEARSVNLLTPTYNCARIKLTVPRDGGSLWEMPFNISAGDRHDQEQDSEQDYVE